MLCLPPPIPNSFFDNFLVECETAHLQCPQFSIFRDVKADLLKKALCLQVRSLMSYETAPTC